MSDEPASHEFDLHVLTQLEKFFGESELNTLVRPPGDGMGVCVTHLPTGRQAVCETYHTQIRNKISCLLTLMLDTPRSP